MGALIWITSRQWRFRIKDTEDPRRASLTSLAFSGRTFTAGQKGVGPHAMKKERTLFVQTVGFCYTLPLIRK